LPSISSSLAVSLSHTQSGKKSTNMVDQSLEEVMEALTAARARVHELEELLTLKQTTRDQLQLDQPVSQNPRTCGKGGRGGGGVLDSVAERRHIAPDFALASCAEATWWHPEKVMPALGSFPVGHIKTCFPRKNGCPRQGSVCPSSLAHLDFCFGNNPHHALDGLEDFSHVWLVFLFNLNGTNYTPKAHIAPPRLKGKVKGVFATRSPHRPNPIGLTLCRLERVEGHRIIMSGVDLVDGTPILDVKPYIPSYDAPFGGRSSVN